MISKLEKRVARLEDTKSGANFFGVCLTKFAMDCRRDPEARKRSGINPDCQLKEPDIETCRRFGQWNIEAVKNMREARKQGKDIHRIVRAIL